MHERFARFAHPGLTRAGSFFTLLFAGVVYAVALRYFVLPSEVILTGSEGIAAALSYYFESYALFIVLYVVFQLALLSFAWMKVGRAFAMRSAAVVATVVAALSLLPEFEVADPAPTNERILLVIFGGLLAGVAKAITFKRRGSTGDEDILGAFFAIKYLRPVGSIAIIAAVVSTAFGLGTDLLKSGQFASAINTLMYTCLYIFISAETLNNLYHKFQLTMFAIVTRQPKEVGDAIRGVSDHRTYTVQRGVGGHSGDPFSMLRTIVTREELPAIRKAVEEADPQCFHYHHDIEGVSSRYYITPIG